MNIVYFVHDQSDAAVWRRADMFLELGASVSMIGFRRRAFAPDGKGKIPIHDLGQTANKKFVQRLLSVARALFTMRSYRRIVASADVIVARNLEMLAIAVVAKLLFQRKAKLFYECLDVHSLMVGGRAISRCMRRVESLLLRSCDGVLISSPAFRRNYFEFYKIFSGEFALLENKVLKDELASGGFTRHRLSAHAQPCPHGPPWTISWLGVIRCRRSLHILDALTRRIPHLVKVNISGVPALDQIEDFHRVVDGNPNISFGGRYDRKRDLAALYRGAHFVWAIDFYEENFNSLWLLPNRLYEGSLFGAIPIALSGTEISRWLVSNDAGVVLGNPLLDTLTGFFLTLTEERYKSERERLDNVEDGKLIGGDAETSLLRSLFTADA